MNFFDKVKSFLITPKESSSTVASSNAFSSAIESCSVAFDALLENGNKEKHQETYKKIRQDFEHRKYFLDIELFTPDSYEKVVDNCTNTTDFDSYDEAYLDAHTTAMGNFDAAFNNLTAIFNNLKSDDTPLYKSCADVYKNFCNIYSYCAQAYSAAVACSMITSLEGKVQALKVQVLAQLLVAFSTNPATTNPTAIKAKADTLEFKATHYSAKAEALEIRARIADEKANIFLAKTDQVKKE